MRRQTAILTSAIAVVIAASAFAALRQDAMEEEKRVRQAAFSYYSGVLLGNAEQTLRSSRHPIASIRDGKVTMRDEKALKTTVAEVARRSRAAGLTDEDRTRIANNMLRVFDGADIRQIGGGTASVVFIVRPSGKEGAGDYLGELILSKSGGQWRVIAEITDSTPAPRLPDLLETPPKDG